MNNGPMVFAAVLLEPVSMAKAMIVVFFTNVMAVFLACVLLLQTDRLSYRGRVLFVAGLGYLSFSPVIWTNGTGGGSATLTR
jgi:hypothetical protein